MKYKELGEQMNLVLDIVVVVAACIPCDTTG